MRVFFEVRGMEFLTIYNYDIHLDFVFSFANTVFCEMCAPRSIISFMSVFTMLGTKTTDLQSNLPTKLKIYFSREVKGLVLLFFLLEICQVKLYDLLC